MLFRSKGAPKRPFRPMATRSTPELFEALRSDDGVERQNAKQILRQRGPQIAAELQSWLQQVQLTDAERERVQLEALWCFQTARSVQPALLKGLLQSTDGRIRAAAVRVLSHWKFLLPDSLELLQGLVQDGHPRVRLEAIRALSFSPLQDSERQLADGSAFGESPAPESAKTVAKYQDPRLIETALLPLRQPWLWELDLVGDVLDSIHLALDAVGLVGLAIDGGWVFVVHTRSALARLAFSSEWPAHGCSERCTNS